MSPENDAASDALLWRAAACLCRAERPLLLIGPEGAAAARSLVGLADALGAVVLTTPDALSLVDSARSFGVFSFGASAHARAAVEEADVVLAVSALGEFTCRLGEAFVKHTLIQVVESVDQARTGRTPHLTLLGPVAVSIERLLAAVGTLSGSWRVPWRSPRAGNEVFAAPPVKAGVIHPVAAIEAIQEVLPENARVCLDITSGALHAYEHLRVTPFQRVFSSIENSACMGEALMASLGIRLASGLPTLALVGDWCFCMSPLELHTAVELELSAYVVVVWANHGGAFIGAGVAQQGIVVPEAAWRWRRAPDFAHVARGLGAVGVTATSASALAEAVREGLGGERPLLIEALIDSEVPVPAGDRFLSLGVAAAKRGIAS